jgi:hypothetical protein
MYEGSVFVCFGFLLFAHLPICTYVITGIKIRIDLIEVRPKSPPGKSVCGKKQSGQKKLYV